MNTKKSLLAILLVFLISNVLTTVWYMLTDEANFVPYRREEMNYLGMILNHLIYASIFIYLFPYYFEKYRKGSYAFLYGVLMSAVMFIPQALVVRSIWEVEINTIFFLNSLAHLVIGGIMGLAAGWIYQFRRA